MPGFHCSCPVLYSYPNRLLSIRNAFQNSALFAEEVKSCCVSSRLDPKLCPFNSNLLGYVSGGDIWLQHLTSGFVSRVTFAHQGQRLSKWRCFFILLPCAMCMPAVKGPMPEMSCILQLSLRTHIYENVHIQSFLL